MNSDGRFFLHWRPDRRPLAILAIAIAPSPARAEMQENYASWPVLRSTFPSTGGGGYVIKGYDPIITGNKCVTTSMAVAPGDNPQVFANVAEFEAVAEQGGILCRNGQWRAFEGGAGHDAVPLLLQGRHVPRAADVNCSLLLI